jgi:hypothetical protein
MWARHEIYKPHSQTAQEVFKPLDELSARALLCGRVQQVEGGVTNVAGKYAQDVDGHVRYAVLDIADVFPADGGEFTQLFLGEPSF